MSPQSIERENAARWYREACAWGSNIERQAALRSLYRTMGEPFGPRREAFLLWCKFETWTVTN